MTLPFSTFARTALIALALAIPAAGPARRPAQRPPAPARLALDPQHVVVPASGGRSVDLSVWAVAHPRGVVIFNHGYGGEPLAYRALLQRIAGAGYAIVAPLSLDSHAGPLKGQVAPDRAFTTRVEDLSLARGYVARRFPGRSVVLAGHSFGSLIALIGGGASTPAGALPGPPVAGVIAFSTPGSVPGLITPDTFRSVGVPLLLVTGDADIVPGFVTDWHDHRRAFDEARAGDKTLIVVRGGTHDLVAKGDPGVVDRIGAATLDFLASVSGHDAVARRRLAMLRSNAVLIVEHR